jgi:hypothetical protein
MNERLTVEEAMTTPLSRNPFKRNRQVHALTSEFVSRGLGADFRGRKFLVQMARSQEEVHPLIESLRRTEAGSRIASAAEPSQADIAIQGLAERVEQLEQEVMQLRERE